MKIVKTFSDVLKIHIEPVSILIILGTSDFTSTLQKSQRQLLSYGLITAKKVWKKKDVPTYKMWLNEMITTLHLEKIQFFLKSRKSQFNKVWLPLICYLNRNS